MHPKTFLKNTWLTIMLSGIAMSISAFFLTQTINKPFIGHHDWNGVQYGNIARNYVRYGLLATKFGQAENAGYLATSQFSFNTHHPVVMPLLLALSVKIFGQQEWSLRLVPILFSLLTVGLTIYLGEVYLGKFSGVAASLLLIVTPMFRYFANMPVHEPIILAAALFVLVSFLRWREGRLRWRWFFASNIFLCLLGWPGYYLSPILFLMDGLWQKKADLKSFTPLWISQIGLFGLHLIHNFVLTGSAFGGGLARILAMRLQTLTAVEEGTQLAFLKFLVHEFRWALVYFTRIQIVLLIIFIFILVLFTVLQREKIIKEKKWLLVSGLLFYGFAHALIFRNAAFIHEYMIFYAGPGIALAAVTGIGLLQKLFIRKQIPILTLLVGVLLSGWGLLERQEFVSVLQQSSMHKTGYDVGNEIKELTDPDELITTYSYPYAMIYGKFLLYYADRNMLFVDEDAIVKRQPGDHQAIIKGYEPPTFVPDEFTSLEHIYFR